MNKTANLDEVVSELTDCELNAVKGGATLNCGAKGDCKVEFNGADVWNQFCFSAGVSGAYIPST